MAVRYTTIQVTPGMRRRLARYKLPGMSYEDVIKVLADAVPPDEFRARHRRALANAAAELRAGVGRSHEGAAREARHLEAQRIAKISPAARMEEAYRLFEVTRGRP